MKNIKKAFKSSLLPLLFIVVLIALFVVFSRKNLSPHHDVQSESYVFSHPSNGPLIETTDLTLVYLPQDKAVATTKTDKLQLKQAVILYNKANVIMPLGGIITKIEIDDNHLSNVTIALPEGTNSQHLSPKAKAITKETISSQRYPLSALQYDSNKNMFVWAAEETNKKNQFKAEKIWLESPAIGDDNFVAGRPINAYSFVILNPNNKIKDDAIYEMSEVIFKAPIQTPIKLAYTRFKQQQYQDKIARLEEKASNCGAGAQSVGTPAPPKTTSCSGNIPQAPSLSPEEIFQSILSRQPAPASNMSSPSCGSSSCSKRPSPPL